MTAHMYTFLHAFMPSCNHAYVQTCMHACMHACVRTYVCSHITQREGGRGNKGNEKSTHTEAVAFKKAGTLNADALHAPIRP